MKTLKTCYYAVAATALLVPMMALAVTNPFETANTMVGNVATNAGIQQQSDLPTMVGKIINIVLGFIGILLLGYILFAGFTYMTAGGDSKKVDTAVAMIKNAVIGLLIVVAAFAISNFVLSSLINVTKV